MFVIFYTVSLLILCIYDLFHILLSYDTLMLPWNVCICVCVCACMFVDGHDEANSRSSKFCNCV